MAEHNPSETASQNESPVRDEGSTESNSSRREVLRGLGVGGVALAGLLGLAETAEAGQPPQGRLQRKRQVSKADLAFVDAAINMYKASQGAKREGTFVDVSNPAACDVVDVVAAVVAVTVVVYHAWNSCLIGEDAALVERLTRVSIKPTVSLEEMVRARNQLAGALKVQ